MVEDAVQTYPFKILKNESWNKSVEDITEALNDLKIESFTKAALEDKLTMMLCFAWELRTCARVSWW
jgi:hypothetical protein